MPELLLALDVGNTTIVMGVFDGSLLLGEWRFSTDKQRTKDEIGLTFLNALRSKDIASGAIRDVIISCVVPSMIDRITEVCGTYFGCCPIEVRPGKEEYLPVAYPDPCQIGADRIVNAVAAYEKYGGPLVIIDFGTATTFCAISRKGAFMGGCIFPGIGISHASLVEHAERLFPVSWERPGSIISRNTDDAIRAGILYGYASLVDGVVKRMKGEIGGDVKVVATGGWAPVIKEETEGIDYMEPSLTLDGLRIIYKRKKGG